MSARPIAGDDLRTLKPGATVWVVASNGVRTEVVDTVTIPEDGELGEFVDIPEWATLFWSLIEDPKYRADWSRLRGYTHFPEEKLSKSH